MLNFPSAARPLAVTACLAGALLPLAAKPGNSSNVEIRLLAFQTDFATAEAYAQDPDAPAETASIKTPIKTYLNHEFATVAPTARRLVFTTKPDRASLTREGEVLGAVTLPEGLRSTILLFLPPKTGSKASSQIMTIDDSKKAFPAGSFRVSNLSPQPVRIVLEDKTYEFKPGTIEFIKDPPVRAGNQSGMMAYTFHNNDWQRIGSGIWPHPGRGRVVQILFFNPLSDQVQLRAFDDVAPRAPTEQAAKDKP